MSIGRTSSEIDHRFELASLAPVALGEIDIEEFADRLVAGATVIDVREPDEYAGGHVPGAELIPLGAVAGHLDRFSVHGTTYVICRSGARSMRVCELAASQGYDVANVTGGTMAWILSGRETITGDSPT
jgi:thioredoxin 1